MGVSAIDNFYHLQKKDRFKMAEICARAFRNDPLLNYLVGNENYPEPYDKDMALPFFEFDVNMISDDAIILALDENVDAFMVWYAPGYEGPDTNKYDSEVISQFIDKFGEDTVKELVKRNEEYEKFSNELRLRQVRKDSWYLALLAVDPDKWGRGLASALLKPFIKMLDDDGQSYYLETHKDRNRKIYEHLGMETGIVSEVPGSNVLHYTLFKKNLN